MLDLPVSHTILIIAITCIVTYLAWQKKSVMDRLIMWPPAMKRGQFDRFITYGFIHADGTHLLFNMFTLFFFGRAIENFYRPYLGGLGFALFYLAALIFSMLPTYLKHRNDPNYLSLGASGAVSAVLFAYILFEPWQLIFVFFIPVPAIIYAVLYTAYSVYSAKRGQDNINHSAHLWGAAFGVIATIAIEPRLIQRFLDKLLNFS